MRVRGHFDFNVKHEGNGFDPSADSKCTCLGFKFFSGNCYGSEYLSLISTIKMKEMEYKYTGGESIQVRGCFDFTDKHEGNDFGGCVHGYALNVLGNNTSTLQEHTAKGGCF